MDFVWPHRPPLLWTLTALSCGRAECVSMSPSPQCTPWETAPAGCTVLSPRHSPAARRPSTRSTWWPPTRSTWSPSTPKSSWRNAGLSCTPGPRGSRGTSWLCRPIAPAATLPLGSCSGTSLPKVGLLHLWWTAAASPLLRMPDAPPPGRGRGVRRGCGAARAGELSQGEAGKGRPLVFTDKSSDSEVFLSYVLVDFAYSVAASVSQHIQISRPRSLISLKLSVVCSFQSTALK